MSKHRAALVVSIALTSLTLLISSPSAHADPTGTEYGLELTLFRPIPDSLPLALERHANDEIPFDQTNKIGILTHTGPDPDVDKDLNVMEMVTPAGDAEHIAIWIEGQTFQTGGDPVPMFTDVVPDDGDMVRFNLDNLFWVDFTGVSIVENLRFLVTFPGTTPDQGVVPNELTVSGDGTKDSPISISADFDALDFDIDNTGLLDATDFHVEFDVIHVPEPSGLLLAVAGVVVCSSFVSRRRMLN